MDYFALAFFLLIVGILALAGCFAIAAYVAKKYPDRNDPDRNRKRYVRPATFLLSFGMGTILGSVVWFIVGIIT